MKQSDFEAIYGLSQNDKIEMVQKLSQDITWDDDSLIEMDEQFETVDDSETLEEVY